MRKLALVSIAFGLLAFSTAASSQMMFGGPPDFNYHAKCMNIRLSLEERIAYCQKEVRDGDNEGRDDAKYQLVTLYSIDGKYDVALVLANKLLDSFIVAQDRVPVLELRSVLFAQMGRYDDAVSDGNAIVDLAVDKVESHNQRCWIRAVAGRSLDQALADCNQALELKPRDAGALDSRGLVNFKLGRLQDALADYNAAIEENPKATLSRFARGVVQIRLGNAKAGKEDMAEAAQRYTDVAKEIASYGMTVPPAN